MVTALVAKQKDAHEILAAIAKRRRRSKLAEPKVWAIRRAMAGATHRRGKVETRGRKQKLSAVQAKRLMAKRKQLVKKANGERYISVDEMTRSARIPKVHSTTAGRYLKKLGVSWRRMREKPPRTEAHEEDRKTVCQAWRSKPATFWTEHVDLIIDAKKFGLPGSAKAAARLRQQKVRGVMRTRQEGLDKGFTRPSLTKHKFNPGGHVHILAGICGGRIVLWEEIQGRWCGDRAAEMYAGPIKAALERWRPGKRSWLIMEDNDPAGFKSSKGKQAKGSNRMKSLDQPPYSPDLNPLDFSLWAAIEKKALATRVTDESATAYKSRLRRTALRMPERIVARAVENIKKRSQAIFDADGGNIKID